MTATPDIIPTDLTLEIDADISPERFLTAARAFFGYVHEISQMLAPDGELAHWVVKVKEGSTLLAVDPARAAPIQVVSLILSRAEEGWERLRKVISKVLDCRRARFGTCERFPKWPKVRRGLDPYQCAFGYGGSRLR